MSSKVSATAIGAFLVGAVVLITGSIIYFGGVGLFGNGADRHAATVIFTGSVKGLNVGAPVTLRGVKIGEVMGIDVSWDPKASEFVIPVLLSINGRDLGHDSNMSGQEFPQSLIARGMRAQLKTQSLLTGLLYIDLDFLPGSEARYVDFPTASPQIPTAPTELEAILQRVSDIDIQAFVKHADDTLKALNALLVNSDTQHIPANINAMLSDMRTLVGNANRQVAETGEQLGSVLGSTDGAIADLRRQIEVLSQRMGTTLDSLDSTFVSVQGAAGDLGYAASEQSPLLFQLSAAIAELERAGRSLQALADSLEREPEALLRGKSAAKKE